MTTLAEPPAGPALDARAFLLPDGGVDLLRERLRAAVDRGASAGSGLGAKVLEAVEGQIAETAAGFLDVDLGAAAVAGWQKHGTLLAAARETCDDPGRTVIVQLAEHDLISTWRPRLDVTVAGAPVAHLSFELTLTFHLVGLHAVVQGGLLTRLGGGAGQVKAQFSVGNRCLLEREEPFDTRLSVPLGDGVPLLGSAEPRPEDTPSVVEDEDASGDDGR